MMVPPLFDFFGLGQQVLAPIAAHADADLVGQGNEQNMQGQQDLQLGWDNWPEELSAAQNQIDLNQVPVAMEQDLNVEPGADDPLEMIINPAQGNDQEEEQQIEAPHRSTNLI